MKDVIKAGSLLVSVAAAGLVFGQAPPAPSAPSAETIQFSSVDMNKDGKLSQAEVRSNADLQTAFTTLDSDRDTYLSQSEFSKWNKAGKSADHAVPKSETEVPADSSKQ
jgi:thiamine biosynthesis lipoprotein ApbE